MSELGDRLFQRLEDVHPGVSQNELARRVDMDRGALSRVMNGKRGLSERELIALAKELRTSTDWILLGEEPFPVEIAARHNYLGNGIYFLDKSDDEDSTVRGIAVAYEQATDLQEWPTKRAVPKDPAAARQLLEQEYGAGWQRHFAEAVERTFGIDVVRVTLPHKSGLTLRLPNAIVIVVPMEAFWARQNWTIAHELEHIASGAFSHDGDLTKAQENAANNFAAELLLPAEEIKSIDWAHVSEADLAAYLWRSGASTEALANRFSYLRIQNPPALSKTTWLVRKHITGETVFENPFAERMQDAASRRFPARLIAAHEANPNTARTLEWLLGAPFESGIDSDDEHESDDWPAIDDVAAAFGMKTE
ncbi:MULTISPECIES: ImmA/IrrE family metallo-endopeptidase [unclassified Frondihabitans]|uniref:helix-turn-helix domain-containing protein n=1 Tax=unclassified Frondihabitans TaxID=2626248 RepID=UPI00131516FD|nr:MULTISPECIES: XRE family transcriptional regulator [unclassified Frondihabitans]